MADPVTIALVITAVGAATGAMAAIKQGQYAQAAADFNTKVSVQNRDIATAQGREAQAMADRQGRMRMGALKAEYGASGIESDTGSALDVLKSSASQTKLEAANVGYSYQLKALGYGNQALLSASEGEAATANSYWSAGAALLSGGAKIAGAKSDA